MKPTLALAVLLAALVQTAWPAVWDNGGDQATWESANNWNPNGVPGSLGNAETTATIGGVYSVTLSSDVTSGSLANVALYAFNGAASLSINSGAVLNLSGYVSVDGSTGAGNTGGSVLTVNNGATITHAALVQIGRIINAPYSGSTSKLVFAGGSYTNSGTGSGSRLEIGHGDNYNTAVFEMKGGTWHTKDSYLSGGGQVTGRSQAIFSGGSFIAPGNSTFMSVEPDSGYQSMLRVDGSGASLVQLGQLQAYRNNANATGSARVEFITDANGVTKITVGTLNLGATANRKADLYVNSNGAIGYQTLTLFSYTTLQNGTFGSVSVLGAPNLFAGTWSGDVNDLALGEYYLSYGDGSSDNITLFYNAELVVPEPGTAALLALGLAGIARWRAGRRIFPKHRWSQSGRCPMVRARAIEHEVCRQPSIALPQRTRV